MEIYRSRLTRVIPANPLPNQDRVNSLTKSRSLSQGNDDLIQSWYVGGDETMSEEKTMRMHEHEDAQPDEDDITSLCLGGEHEWCGVYVAGPEPDCRCHCH